MITTGIIGYPLEVTLSPRMHKAAFKEANIEGVYLKMVVRPEHLKTALQALKMNGFRGVNVTNPHKEALLLFVSDITDTAREVGAVNTVLFRDDEIIGDNTDVFGFQRSLDNLPLRIGDTAVLLIGAGGVARAAAFGLSQRQLQDFFIVNRTVSKARHLAKKYGAEALSLDEMPSALSRAKLVINATSVDMQSSVIANLSKDSWYLDLNYRYTLQERNGIRMVNGLEMLVYQGARSFEIWTKKKPSIETMKKVLGM